MKLYTWVSTRNQPTATATDFPHHWQDHLLQTWSHRRNLHTWMAALYRHKGGQARDFTMATLQLTAADVDRLHADILADNLPPTLRLAATPVDSRADDLAFVAKARQAIALGKTLTYASWT